MSKYVLLVESGADVTPELAEQHNIRIVPMHVYLGETSIRDGEVPVEDVFSFFDKTHILPKTSGCMPSDFSKVFDEIHAEYPKATIIHLAYSAVTTCSYESAMSAAEGRDYVKHYDTKNVSIGQAMIALSVAAFLERNPEVTYNELDQVIQDRINRARMAFMPEALDYLHAGGRLSNIAFISARTLKFKPLIEVVEGKLIATKKYRGSMKAAVGKMIHSYLESTPLNKDFLYLVYSPGLSQDIKILAEKLVRDFGFKKYRWLKTGCVVSSHGGPGAFGVAGLAENAS